MEYTDIEIVEHIRNYSYFNKFKDLSIDEEDNFHSGFFTLSAVINYSDYKKTTTIDTICNEFKKDIIKKGYKINIYNIEPRINIDLEARNKLVETYRFIHPGINTDKINVLTIVFYYKGVI